MAAATEPKRLAGRKRSREEEDDEILKCFGGTKWSRQNNKEIPKRFAGTNRSRQNYEEIWGGVDDFEEEGDWEVYWTPKDTDLVIEELENLEKQELLKKKRNIDKIFEKTKAKRDLAHMNLQTCAEQLEEFTSKGIIEILFKHPTKYDDLVKQAQKLKNIFKKAEYKLNKCIVEKKWLDSN